MDPIRTSVAGTPVSRDTSTVSNRCASARGDRPSTHRTSTVGTGSPPDSTMRTELGEQSVKRLPEPGETTIGSTVDLIGPRGKGMGSYEIVSAARETCVQGSHIARIGVPPEGAGIEVVDVSIARLMLSSGDIVYIRDADGDHRLGVRKGRCKCGAKTIKLDVKRIRPLVRCRRFMNRADSSAGAPDRPTSPRQAPRI